MIAGIDHSPEDAQRLLCAFLDTKGRLHAQLAVLCVAAWIERERGQGPFSTREVGMLYPRRDRPPGAPALRSVPDALREAARLELVERIARAARGGRESFYVITDLGRAVVAALPDLRAVSELRGLGRITHGGRLPPEGR